MSKGSVHIRLKAGDPVICVTAKRGRDMAKHGTVLQGEAGLVVSWSDPPVLDDLCEPVSEGGLLHPDRPLRTLEIGRRAWPRPVPPLSPGDRVYYGGGLEVPSGNNKLDTGTVIHDGAALAVRWDLDGIEDRITPDGVAVDFGFVAVRLPGTEG